MKRIGELRTTLALTSNRSTMRRNIMNAFLRSVLRLLVTANGSSRSLILFTLMFEAKRPSETPVLTTATWGNIPETVLFIVVAVKTLNLTR
jgi:hypothetical protein